MNRSRCAKCHMIPAGQHGDHLDHKGTGNKSRKAGETVVYLIEDLQVDTC